VDQHGAASGITGILNREGPAIRCANGTLYVSPRISVAIRVRSAGLYVPATAGCHSRASLPAGAGPRTGSELLPTGINGLFDYPARIVFAAASVPGRAQSGQKGKNQR
jgi:hypothetical protein